MKSYLLYVIGCSLSCYVSAWMIPTNPSRQTCSRSGFTSRTRASTTSTTTTCLFERKKGERVSAWDIQAAVLAEMKKDDDEGIRQGMRDKFAARRIALVVDTAYFGFFIFCILWSSFANPFVAISYLFGATMGLAYSYGLGRYVENLGGSAEDASSVQGAGVGEARFAFLILLFIVVGKFRDQGLLEIPAIAGFFTYQVATLNQGLREIND